MIKKIGFVLLILVVISIGLPSTKADATINSLELKLNSGISQWEVDEASKTIYAISETSNYMYFINSTTLVLEKSLKLSAKPTNIIKDNGQLYVTLDGINKIIVIDMKSRALSFTITLPNVPSNIVKDGDDLYYVIENNNYHNIFKYNLSTKLNEEINNQLDFSKPALAINTVDHILYIGESGTAGSNLYYYNTVDKNMIEKSNYDNGYGFTNWYRSTYYDGYRVYFAGWEFDKNTPTKMNGYFGNKDCVLYVNNDLVYTNYGMYDLNTHAQIGTFKDEKKLIYSTNNTIFLYGKNTKTIKRLQNISTINSSNVLSLVSGEKTKILETVKGKKLNAGINTLVMNPWLSQWFLSESNNMIYAISKTEKALFFINATTLDIEKALPFTAPPSDIIEDDGKLYIALDQTHQIVVVDIAKKSITKKLYTSIDPCRIAKDGNNLYYVQANTVSDVYKYELMTNKEQNLNTGGIVSPDLEINTEDHILYIGESCNDEIYYYDTINEKMIGHSDIQFDLGFTTNGSTLYDGEKVYYAGCSFDKKDPLKILGQYSDEDIVLAKCGLVFTNSYAFNSNTFDPIEYFGDDITLYEVSNKFVLYLYNKYENTIVRMDASKIATVNFDSMGGSVVNRVIVDKNSLLTPTEKPTRLGYYFNGWYKDKNYKSAWNFSKDYVRSDMTLYAKWTLDKKMPKSVKAVSSSYNSIKISWNKVSGVKGYKVYRATSVTGKYSLVATTKSTSYINKSLDTGKTYYYKVISYSLSGKKTVNSTFSAAASAKSLLNVPGKLKVTKNKHKVTVTWSPVAGASGYDVYCKCTLFDGWDETSSKTTYSYGYMIKGHTYQFSVRAYRMVGKVKVYGAWSKTITLKM